MDKISDMLTRIRNAQMAGKNEAVVPFSNLKMAIAKILKEEGYISEYRKKTTGSINNIVITLKYENLSANRSLPAITGIKQISKSGRRIYAGKKDIKRIKQGYGIAIISTSKGVMSSEEARKKGIGGELICEVW